MERIQSAIIKAREARRDQQAAAQAGQAAAPGPVARATGPVGPAAAAPGPRDLAAADLVPADFAPAAPVGFDPSAIDPALRAAAEVDAAWQALPLYRPDPKHLERGRCVSFAGGPAAAPFDVMRTKLLQQVRGKGWKRIAITSPGPGCGKTMIALNLAFSLARQHDVRCIVIEMDLRRPSMARILGDRSGHQVSEALAGRAAVADHLIGHGRNLGFGTNCKPVAHSAELLQGPEAVAALDMIEARYQPTLMLFDMPPMQISDDTMAAMGLMDAALLVGAAETTTIAEIDRCEQELATRTNVMGVVLNKCRYLDKSEGYGYGYDY
jgi:protein-tyrosine kinase